MLLSHLSEGLEPPLAPGPALQQQVGSLSQRGCLVNGGSLSLTSQGHFFGFSLGCKGLPFRERLPGFRFQHQCCLSCVIVSKSLCATASLYARQGSSQYLCPRAAVRTRCDHALQPLKAWLAPMIPKCVSALPLTFPQPALHSVQRIRVGHFKCQSWCWGFSSDHARSWGLRPRGG